MGGISGGGVLKGHESVGVGGGVFCSFTFFSGAVAVLVVLPGVFGFGHGFWGTRFPHVVTFLRLLVVVVLLWDESGLWWSGREFW